eukprot:4432405-Amphidinium_carterae.1
MVPNARHQHFSVAHLVGKQLVGPPLLVEHRNDATCQPSAPLFPGPDVARYHMVWEASLLTVSGLIELRAATMKQSDMQVVKHKLCQNSCVVDCSELLQVYSKRCLVGQS